MFGLLFPFFIALTWVMGREIPGTQLFTGITSMTVFFTSSAMSPVILPWETREKGLERQITAPLNLTAILWGIISASTLFSLVITAIVSMILGVGAGISFSTPGSFIGFLGGLFLMGLIGSLVGVLVSAPPTDQLPDIMTLANLVKFPLLFISGIFIPLHQLSFPLSLVAWFSPLTPLVDVVASCVGDIEILPLPLDLCILTGWTLALYALSWYAHSKTFERRFSR